MKPRRRVTLAQRLPAAVGCLGLVLAAPAAAQSHAVRIVQTNAAGDRVPLIDPTTNAVVAVIPGISKAHGVTSSPDGRTLYITNEIERAVDVVPTATLEVASRIPLSERPNNLAITPDGKRLYVAIAAAALVDVVDLEAGRVVKSIPTAGGVHNTFISPDGRYVAAGMIGARTLTMIDTRTDAPAWSIEFGGDTGGEYADGGVRPIAFAANPDGSTKWIFVQLSNYHGVVVIDFATRQEVRRLEMPTLPLTEQSNDGLQGSPAHGLAVSPDGTQLFSTSKPTDHVYAWSLPDFRFLGGVHVGHHPDWLTMTPDGRFLYAANAGSNDVSAIDTRTLEEVARIPVGQTPKRNHTLVLP